MIFNTDCKHFRSDRPCAIHKLKGQLCIGCPEYVQQEENVLILKFDAIGDVLRTTSILKALKHKHPFAKISWYTRKVCADLFKNNSDVDELFFAEEPMANWQLIAREFTCVYSLDPNPQIASIAATVRTKKIIGFTVNDLGVTIPSNKNAQVWYNLGLDDSLKKANTRTFFEHIFALAELELAYLQKPALIISQEEQEEALIIATKLCINRQKKIVALCPGAGKRWQHKQWGKNNFIELVKMLSDKDNIQIVLSGGEEDQDIISSICSDIQSTNNVIIHSPLKLRKFILLMSNYNLVVCGDTLPMHIATALGLPVIAIFGPTSSAEIDLFGQGAKIEANIPCTCCYKSTCSVNPNCMDLINPQRIYSEILTVLRS